MESKRARVRYQSSNDRSGKRRILCFVQFHPSLALAPAPSSSPSCHNPPLAKIGTHEDDASGNKRPAGRDRVSAADDDEHRSRREDPVKKRRMEDEVAAGEKMRPPAVPKTSSDRRHHHHHHHHHDRQKQQGEQVRASHILIKHEGSRRKASWKDPDGRSISATTREVAVARLRDLRESILSGEARFEDVAAQHSDCSSAKRGGDLGRFGKGRMQKPFEEAASSLKVGDISDIVDTDSGAHIILRTG